MKNRHELNIKSQAGYSIVELMIAGALGLILLTGVVQLFLGSNQNFTMQDELANIQEDGRFALSFLEDQIQMGSWTEDQIVPPAIDLANSDDGDNDTITISYRTVVDGLNNRDCNGNITGALVTNRFFVNGTDLMCLGNGSATAQPFISNVERFQVLYGVETDVNCPDGVVNSYVNHSSIGLNTNILSVRIALLLRSSGDVLPEAESNTFQLLDQSFTTPSDNMIRRLFQQTIFMPNAVYATVGSPQAVIECMSTRI